MPTRSTTLNLNYVSETLLPGQIANLQGGGFTTGTQVWAQPVNTSGSLVGSAQSLTLQSQSANLLQVEIPPGFPAGLFALWLTDSLGAVSQTRYANQANGTRFSTDAVGPGGTLEVWGRNLGGYTGVSSSLTFVDGGGNRTSATVTYADANHLIATVPGGLTVGGTYTVRIANGYGGSLGETLITASLVIRTAENDYLGLGVPWAADFAFVPSNGNNLAAHYGGTTSSGPVWNVFTDTRLSLHAVGNGVTDDGPAIRAAIAAATTAGGGMVYLPTATYVLSSGTGTGTWAIYEPDNVILAGDGPSATILILGTANSAAVNGVKLSGMTSLIGFKDLGISYLGTGTAWLAGTISEVFFKNCALSCNQSPSIQLSDITHFLLLDCTVQAEYNTPIYLSSDWMIVDGCTFNYRYSRITVTGSKYPIIRNSTFNPDAAYRLAGTQNGVLECSYTVQAVLQNNTVNTVNYTEGTYPTNAQEGFLFQSYQADHFFFATGTVTSAGANTLTDSAQSWPVSYFGGAYGASVAPGQQIVLLTGIGAGQVCPVSAMTSSQVTIEGEWSFIPNAGDHYALTGFACNQPYILGNTFNNNLAYAIELYIDAYAATVVGNTILSQAGIPIDQPSGIYLVGEARLRAPVEGWSPIPYPPGAPVDQISPVCYCQVFRNVLTNQQPGKAVNITLDAGIVNGEAPAPLCWANEIRNNTIVEVGVNASSGYFVTVVNQNPGNVPALAGSLITGTIFQDNDGTNLPTPAYTLTPLYQAQTSLVPTDMTQSAGLLHLGLTPLPLLTTQVKVAQ